MIEWRNPERLTDGRIDCEVNHPVLGWLPTTVSPDDAETAALFAEIEASGDDIPDAVRVLRVPNLTFRQLMIGLTEQGWITREEGRQWLRRNDLPAVATDLIEATYPDDEAAQFEAEADMLAITTAERAHPLVAALAAQRGLSSEQVDDFFRAYASR